MSKFLKIIILIVLSVINVAGQNYKNLIFEGAGIRGIAYAGVIQGFEDRGIMEDIEKVGGTSAGAIVALCISLGYSSAEIKEIIGETDFQDFNDGNMGIIGGGWRLLKRYGWYKGDSFEIWLSKIIKRKTNNENLTFEELNELGFIDLYVTATSLNRQKLIVFSKETYPKMRIKDAVRISCLFRYISKLFLLIRLEMFIRNKTKTVLWI